MNLDDFKNEKPIIHRFDSLNTNRPDTEALTAGELLRYNSEAQRAALPLQTVGDLRKLIERRDPLVFYTFDRVCQDYRPIMETQTEASLAGGGMFRVFSEDGRPLALWGLTSSGRTPVTVREYPSTDKNGRRVINVDVVFCESKIKRLDAEKKPYRIYGIR